MKILTNTSFVVLFLNSGRWIYFYFSTSTSGIQRCTAGIHEKEDNLCIEKVRQGASCTDRRSWVHDTSNVL